MPTPWFIAPPEGWTDDEVVLPADESHHASKALRVAPPDVITVTDGRGVVAKCAVTGNRDGGLVAQILEREERRPVKPQVVVYQGAPKGSKADDVVERLAELGVGETWVFDSERAVARWDAAKVKRLNERWIALSSAAAKQSRNPYVMQAGAGLSWTELLRRVAREPLALVLWEASSLPMRTAFVGEADRVALVVGPEGGFTREEAEALADAGGQLVSLGPRILRTENAALVAASVLFFHFGLIG